MSNYDGLLKFEWPGTWSPLGNYPVALSTDIRGGLQHVSGDPGAQITDIPGIFLEPGMLVYDQTQDKYFQYKLLQGQSRNSFGQVPNTVGNWTEFQISGGSGQDIHFKGIFSGTAGLPSTGTAGDYCYVDPGVGYDIVTYAYDGTDFKWVKQEIAQIQSDVNETDPQSPAYIKNFPIIPKKTSDLPNDVPYLVPITDTWTISGTAAAPPGSADGMRYIVSGTGTFDSTALKTGDVVEFYGNLTHVTIIPKTPIRNYNNIPGIPTLGTASSKDIAFFATDAQGATADTAVQPSDLQVVAVSGKYADLIDEPVAVDQAAAIAGTDAYNYMTPLAFAQTLAGKYATNAEALSGTSDTVLMSPKDVNDYLSDKINGIVTAYKAIATPTKTFSEYLIEQLPLVFT